MKKNVILLTIDALRKDMPGCYGNKSGLTPFIDSLQDKCIRFTKGASQRAVYPSLISGNTHLLLLS